MWRNFGKIPAGFLDTLKEYYREDVERLGEYGIDQASGSTLAAAGLGPHGGRISRGGVWGRTAPPDCTRRTGATDTDPAVSLSCYHLLRNLPVCIAKDGLFVLY